MSDSYSSIVKLQPLPSLCFHSILEILTQPLKSLSISKFQAKGGVSYEGGSTTPVGCDGFLQDLCLEVLTVHGNEFSLLDYEIVPLSPFYSLLWQRHVTSYNLSTLLLIFYKIRNFQMCTRDNSITGQFVQFLNQF